MSAIRIGIDIRELRRDVKTGIARYISNFLMVAARLKPEWEFVLFGNQHTFAPALAGDYKKVIISEGSTFWWDQVELPRALKKERIDLFLSPYHKAPFFAPCKVAITIHDLTPFLPFLPHQKESFVKVMLKKIVGRLIARKVDLIVTVSQHSKKDIINLFGIPEEKVSVAYNGIPELFSPVKDANLLEAVRKKYTLARDYILYVGNLLPHKNVDGLLKAYARLPGDLIARYQLAIVAKKDDNFKILLKLCEELKIADKVIFIDFADDGDLPVLYSMASVFVFPSFYEGFGLPVLEAMACGVPVLCSSAASLPEVAGDAAISFDPHNTEEITMVIGKILSDYALRRELSVKGLERAKNFSLEKTAGNIIESIEEVL